MTIDADAIRPGFVPAWAVLNIPCTRILSTHATEAEAVAAASADPGAFVYELSDAEARAISQIGA